MQQQSFKTIWRTYAMIHKPIFKKQFGFSKDKPHQVLHSCATLLGCWVAPRTYGEWKKNCKKVSESVIGGQTKWSQMDRRKGEVSRTHPVSRTWGPRESRWVVWHCRRAFTTPESSRNGQAHERSIRQAFWNMKYGLDIDMICQRQGVKGLGITL